MSSNAVNEDEESNDIPPSFFLLTPFRFRLPRTKPLIFGKILEEISDYGMTESYYRTLDYATKLRKEVVKCIEHYATVEAVPPAKDNLRELDEIACRLYAGAAHILEAIEDYLPTLFLLLRLEKDNHIQFRKGEWVQWATAFPLGEEEMETTRFSRGHSINYELCHVIFLQGICEYTRAARGLYKLRSSKSSTTAAKTWQFLRLSAGTLFHVCINSAHDHNDYEGKEQLNPEVTAGVLNLLAALIIAQTQHVVYVRAVSSGATLFALERVCYDLIKAYGRVGNALGTLIIGDNEELKALMIANDWYLALVKLIYLKNGVLLRASKRQFLQAEVWAQVGLGICRSRGHTMVHVTESSKKTFSNFMKSERYAFQKFVDEYKQINEELKVPRGPAAHMRTRIMTDLNADEQKVSIASLSSSVSSMVPYQEHIIEEHELNDYVDFFSGPRASRRIAYDEKLAKKEEEGGFSDEDDEMITKDGMKISGKLGEDSKNMTSSSKYHKWSSSQAGKTGMLFERIRTSDEYGYEYHSPTKKELKESVEARKKSIVDKKIRIAALLDDNVDREHVGLEKQYDECGLCCQQFASLEGSVTFKAIQTLRHKWGMKVDKRKRANTATILYTQTPVCAFCLQFFYPNNTELELRREKNTKRSKGEEGKEGSKYDNYENDDKKVSGKKKQQDEYSKYIVSGSFKKPKEDFSLSLTGPDNAMYTVKLKSPPSSINQLVRSRKSLQGKYDTMSIPDNASFINLKAPRKYFSNKDLPHYHSPSFPMKSLERSGIIPGSVIATHGWDLDGDVDNLFYETAINYDEDDIFEARKKVLEIYFKENGEVKTLHEYFSYLLSAREKIEGKGMLHPDSISLPFLVHEYERKDYHLLAAAKKSRHLISIAESGGLALLRKLVTRDKVNHIDWTQFLTILKTVVTPCSICASHNNNCQTFKFRPNPHGPDYCACGHSLKKHVNPTLSVTPNTIAREDDTSSPYHKKQPSTWISPARKQKIRKHKFSNDEINAQILEETLTHGRTTKDMKAHHKRIVSAEANYNRLLPVIKKATMLHERGKTNIPADGNQRRRMLSNSIKTHIDEKEQRENPRNNRRPSTAGGALERKKSELKSLQTTTKIQKIKIMCGLCRQYFTLDNLQCLATRGRLLEIREEFKYRGERRKRAEFLEGKHVQIDETSHPIDGGTILSEKYGRVTKTNIQLEQVYVVHLDGARAWYRVKDTWDWSVEDENSFKMTKTGRQSRKSRSGQSRKKGGVYDMKPSTAGRIAFLKKRSKQLKKYDKVRICVFCAQLYDHACETLAAEEKDEADLLQGEKEKKRKAMGRDGMDQLAIFKAEMKAKKKRLEEEQLEEERLKQEKIDAQKFQRQVEKDRRHAIKQQYKTDAGTERQLSEEDRKHAQIKRWEEENNLKYFELPMEKRRRIKEQLEEEEVFRISKEAEDLNILLDKIGLNLTTIPFSLAQLRAMSLKRRLRTIAAIRIQALGRGFIHRIRIVRRLGGDGASLEQGIDELREKIAEVQKKKLELERIRMEREKKKVEARLMEEKRQRELKAKKKRREMLEQYEMKHNKKK